MSAARPGRCRQSSCSRRQGRVVIALLIPLPFKLRLRRGAPGSGEPIFQGVLDDVAELGVEGSVNGEFEDLLPVKDGMGRVGLGVAASGKNPPAGDELNDDVGRDLHSGGLAGQSQVERAMDHDWDGMVTV